MTANFNSTLKLAAPQEKGILGRLLRDTRGLSSVEYVILLMLLAVGGISVWGNLGTAITGKVTTAQEDVGKLGGEEAKTE